MKGMLKKWNRRLLGRSDGGYPGRRAIEAYFRMLSTERNTGEQVETYYEKKLWLLFLVLLTGILLTLLLLVSARGARTLEDGYYLPRKEDSYTEELWVIPEDGKKEKQTVEIGPKGKTEAEIKELLAQEKAKLEGYILGENPSLEEVRSDMNLIREIDGTPITLEWELDSYEVLNLDGSIREDKVTKEGTIVGLRARLFCENQECVYEAYARILPRLLSPVEQWQQALTEAVASFQGKSRLEERMELPTEANGVKLVWKEAKASEVWAIPLLTVLCLALLYVAKDQEVKKQVKERERQMQRDYAPIVSKLLLLLGAGSSVKIAWEMIVADYQRKKGIGKPRYAYEEMALTLREMQSGVAETRAYENFGVRCGLPCYLKLSALLEQNLKKGSRGLSGLLQAETAEAFEQRKELAREQGEEAATKLLLPMVGMLVVVMLLILVPAGMSMKL